MRKSFLVALFVVLASSCAWTYPPANKLKASPEAVHPGPERIAALLGAGSVVAEVHLLPHKEANLTFYGLRMPDRAAVVSLDEKLLLAAQLRGLKGRKVRISIVELEE